MEDVLPKWKTFVPAEPLVKKGHNNNNNKKKKKKYISKALYPSISDLHEAKSTVPVQLKPSTKPTIKQNKDPATSIKIRG